jgi:hypothetical protein
MCNFSAKVKILKIRFFCFQTNLIFSHQTLVKKGTGENQPYYLHTADAVYPQICICKMQENKK